MGKKLMKFEKSNNKDQSIIELIQSKQFLLKLTIAMMALFSLFWIVLVVNENRIYKVDEEDLVFADPSEYITKLDCVEWQADGISVTDDYVGISGWIIKPGESVEQVAIKVIIRDVETGIFYVLPTTVVERPDVTQHMNDGNLYDCCGFGNKIPYWEGLDNGKDYELFAQYDLNDNTRVVVPFCTTLKKIAEEKK